MTPAIRHNRRRPADWDAPPAGDGRGLGTVRRSVRRSFRVTRRSESRSVPGLRTEANLQHRPLLTRQPHQPEGPVHQVQPEPTGGPAMRPRRTQGRPAEPRGTPSARRAVVWAPGVKGRLPTKLSTPPPVSVPTVSASWLPPHWRRPPRSSTMADAGPPTNKPSMRLPFAARLGLGGNAAPGPHASLIPAPPKGAWHSVDRSSGPPSQIPPIDALWRNGPAAAPSPAPYPSPYRFIGKPELLRRQARTASSDRGDVSQIGRPGSTLRAGQAMARLEQECAGGRQKCRPAPAPERADAG